MAQNRYVFAQRDVDDFSCIKIVEGEYSGIIYTYGHVKFASEENSKGELPMKFDYDIIFNPHEMDIDKKEFIDYIGDILIEQLEKQVSEGTAVYE